MNTKTTDMYKLLISDYTCVVIEGSEDSLDVVKATREEIIAMLGDGVDYHFTTEFDNFFSEVAFEETDPVGWQSMGDYLCAVADRCSNSYAGCYENISDYKAALERDGIL